MTTKLTTTKTNIDRQVSPSKKRFNGNTKQRHVQKTLKLSDGSLLCQHKPPFNTASQPTNTIFHRDVGTATPVRRASSFCIVDVADCLVVCGQLIGLIRLVRTDDGRRLLRFAGFVDCCGGAVCPIGW